MGRVIYSMNVSLDGFVETAERGLEWGRIDAELHTHFNDEAREVGAFVYGRRIYELMIGYWPTAADDPDATATERDFAEIWNAKPKVVFSRTLDRVEGNSRLVREDVAAALEGLRAEIPGDLAVGGATLAAALIREDLIDEYRPVLHPVILGSGTPYFPNDAPRLDLRLIRTRTFASGVTALRYARAR